MNEQRYDLIGDIHGHYDKASALLERLGYEPDGTTWRHLGGRKVIFLGDYIDRGPKIRETLHLVRGMVEAGDALALMGNHEFNAVIYATPDGKGGHLRPHHESNVAQHAVTLATFAGREEEWAGWLAWFRTLPMYLDLGGLRAVHAAWDARHLEMLKGAPLMDDAFLHLAGTYRTPEFKAVEVLLKGPELALPEGLLFTDKEGIPRKKVRVRWWGIKEGVTLGEVVMPEPMEVTIPLEAHQIRTMASYPLDEPPVFFGHYWMNPEGPQVPLAPNIVCLDYSAAFGKNPLHAYRWDGERVPLAEKFVTANGRA